MPIFTGVETLNETSLVDLLRDPGFLDFFRGGARKFNYAQNLSASDAMCMQAFLARKFIHHDWVDGQDVVQAGQTADNVGFNFLFHSLEADLDAAKTDITTLFGCIARLRAELAARLEEIKAELNRLDADVWTLTPNKSLVSKIPPSRFLGVTKIGEEQMAILRNDDGSVMTMALKTDVIRPGLITGADDRFHNAGSFAAFVASNSDVAGMFANNRTPTTAEIISKFGGVTLDNGKTVTDVLGTLPATTTYRSPTELSDAVADHEAAIVRSSSDVAVARTALGGTPADAPLSNIGTIDATTRTALESAGIRTVADLANADPQRLATATGSSANAARVRAIGRTIRGIG